jgi:hypothetical protein
MDDTKKREKIDKASDFLLLVIAILVVAFVVFGSVELINWFKQPNEFVGISNLKDVNYGNTGGLLSTKTVKLSFDNGVIIEYKGDQASDGYRIGEQYEIWHSHSNYYAIETND